MLWLALLTTPAMAQDRYVLTQYRAGGAPPHFIGSFETRGACDEVRARMVEEAMAARHAARQELERAARVVPADVQGRERALETERNNLQAAVRGSRRERVVQDRLAEVGRELEALRLAEQAWHTARSNDERLALHERTLQESSICERR